MANNYKIIDWDETFVFHITVKVKNGLKGYCHLLETYLKDEGFVFDIELHDDKYHVHVICESFTDAAKIETFLATNPIIN